MIYPAHRHIPQSKLRRGVQALSVAILVLTGLQRIYAGSALAGATWRVVPWGVRSRWS